MAKKVKKRTRKPTLADDLRASWEEALKYARGEKADVIVHHVTPSDTDARLARHKLGLSRREFAACSAPASAPCANGSLARGGRRVPHAR
jgi:hypothetical protein